MLNLPLLLFKCFIAVMTGHLPSIAFAQINFVDGSTSISSPAAQTMVFTTNSAEKMRLHSNGNIGIGTSTPATTLDIAGQLKGGFVTHSSLTSNWSAGNIQQTSVGPGTLAFTAGSMHDGANYTLILTTAGTFTLGTSGDITSWRCLPACGSNQITATGHTVLTIIKAGTTGYVSWIPGF